jgi:hypothetical protein
MPYIVDESNYKLPGEDQDAPFPNDERTVPYEQRTAMWDGKVPKLDGAMMVVAYPGDTVMLLCPVNVPPATLAAMSAELRERGWPDDIKIVVAEGFTGAVVARREWVDGS